MMFGLPGRLENFLASENALQILRGSMYPSNEIDPIGFPKSKMRMDVFVGNLAARINSCLEALRISGMAPISARIHFQGDWRVPATIARLVQVPCHLPEQANF